MASINFITAHDGFTLNDLVSYNEKHNEANGENNADGENHNRSWNCGVEGTTNNPNVTQLREKQKRNFLTTLLLSQGVPMLAHGDEISRTQGGNNNGYCQDNEITWVNWELGEHELALRDFLRNLIALRKTHPVFRRRRFLNGESWKGSAGLEDVVWMRPDGSVMQEADWQTGYAQSLMVFVNGHGVHEPDDRGGNIVDDDFLLVFNASNDCVDFSFPEAHYSTSWKDVLSTGSNMQAEHTYRPQEHFVADGHTVRVFVHQREPEPDQVPAPGAIGGFASDLTA